LEDVAAEEKHAASVRAAIMNLIGDIFKSIGIILVSIALYYYPDADIIDPIYTAILSIFIILGTFSLADECIHELVGGAPESLDMIKLK